MEFDDFSGIDGYAFSKLMGDITRPTKTDNLWWCPVGNKSVVNFNNVARFDVKNRILHFNITKEGLDNGVKPIIKVEIRYMEMALFAWEQANISKNETP